MLVIFNVFISCIESKNLVFFDPNIIKNMYLLNKNKNKSIKINYSKSSTDSLLCYCSKISHELFEDSLKKNINYNINDICNEHNIGKKCSACLPNVEEYYLKIRGKNGSSFRGLSNKSLPSLKKKVLNLVDSLFGNRFVIQHGYLPIINSSFVKTWLIISNYFPLKIIGKSVPYEINFDLFNSNGTKINSLNKKIYPNSSFKICFQEFIENSSDEIETYFAKVSRKGLGKGLRGSIRPHFFYESKKSMASVHTQDGASKSIFLDFYRSKNNDHYYLFIINPYKYRTVYQLNSFSKKLNSFKNIYESSIIGMGSKLVKINDFYKNNSDGLVECSSNNGLKHYLIIADKKFEKFSVDHL